MKTDHQISMEYNRVLTLTDELDRLADKLSKEVNENTNSNLGALFAGWKGDNASEFMKLISQMQANSKSTASAIRKIADGIRSNAKMVYNAEMEALRLINTKSH